MYCWLFMLSILCPQLLVIASNHNFHEKFASISEDSRPVCSRHLLQKDAWHHDAMRNVSHWRTHLLDKIFAIHAQPAPVSVVPAVPNTDALPVPSHFASMALYKSELFEPAVTCPIHAPLTRYGSATDGGKLLCSVSHLKEGCVIYSIGSQLQYDFEEGMLAATPCEVHTFDCTVAGTSQGDRHFFHQKCIGSKAVPDPMYITLKEAMQNNSHTFVNLLKVDIEGFEYDLFPHWCEDEVEFLPHQISFETHNWYPKIPGYKVTTLDLAVFFMHLSNLGYGLVSKEVNQWGAFDQETQDWCCSEFTAIRIDASSIV